MREREIGRGTERKRERGTERKREGERVKESEREREELRVSLRNSLFCSFLYHHSSGISTNLFLPIVVSKCVLTKSS